MSLELTDLVPIIIAIGFVVTLTVYMNRKPSRQ